MKTRISCARSPAGARRCVAAVLTERAIDEKVTDEKLQEVTRPRREKAEPDFAKDEVKARHILLKTEDEVKEIIKELDGGADFAELAKEKSTGPSGPNGGDLGYFERGAMVLEFGEAAFRHGTGKLFQGPGETQFGWHVILVEDKRQNVPTFEETGTAAASGTGLPCCRRGT
ncbi:MAG: peptidylprolyl isomerase [Geminicoccaceae bacterium]